MKKVKRGLFESYSQTTTLNVHCAKLPELSVKVYVTGVTPIEKTAPGEAVDSSITSPPAASLAVGSVHVTCTLDVPSAMV